MNIFEEASRVKLRFDLQGQLSAEQLWSANIDGLIAFESSLEDSIEKYGKQTRRSKNVISEAQKIQKLRLEIVTYIIDIRQAEQETAKTAAANKVHNQKVMELIKSKQDSKMAEMSEEELLKLLK